MTAAKEIDTLWAIRFAAIFACIASVKDTFPYNTIGLVLIYVAARWRMNVLRKRVTEQELKPAKEK